jgi:hypothetical protein
MARQCRQQGRQGKEPRRYLTVAARFNIKAASVHLKRPFLCQRSENSRETAKKKPAGKADGLLVTTRKEI